MLKRFFVYLAINAAVIVAISALLNLLGVRPYIAAQGINYTGLLIFCGAFGFLGSFISLQLSRWAAKRAMGVILIDPSSPTSSTASAALSLTSRINAYSNVTRRFVFSM